MGYRAYFGKIRAGKRREYIEAHKAVWPELLEVMRQAGISRESCFVLEDYVVVYLEGDNIEATMDQLSENPISQRWDSFMEGILEPPISDRPDFFPEMAEVFKL
jgi:L-rhamnose mutarotase